MESEIYLLIKMVIRTFDGVTDLKSAEKLISEAPSMAVQQPYLVDFYVVKMS